LLPAPSAGSPLANPVRVALYYPRNVTDALTLRYTLDGSAVTNASLIFTNDTQLGTSFRSNFLDALHFSLCRVCLCPVVWRTTTIRARVFPPPGVAAWFLPSEETQARYQFLAVESTGESSSDDSAGICGDMVVRRPCPRLPALSACAVVCAVVRVR
jgi:hypothetical protein